MGRPSAANNVPAPYLPGVAQPFVQRGNDHLSCFHDDEDRRRYLTAPRQSLRANHAPEEDTLETPLIVLVSIDQRVRIAESADEDAIRDRLHLIGAKVART